MKPLGSVLGRTGFHYPNHKFRVQLSHMTGSTQFLGLPFLDAGMLALDLRHRLLVEPAESITIHLSMLLVFSGVFTFLVDAYPLYA